MLIYESLKLVVSSGETDIFLLFTFSSNYKSNNQRVIDSFH